MSHLHLFTDGSVHTQSKFGVGAYLLLSDTNVPIASLNARVKLKQFDNTSSTKLELQTLLWALNELSAKVITEDLILTIYTDSQNIITLPARQTRLESNNYISRNHKPLANAELYQDFYRLTNDLSYNLTGFNANIYTPNKYILVKVKGHKVSSEKDKIDQLFSLVDQAARCGLREKLDD
jgi:ribonuclease HI